MNKRLSLSKLLSSNRFVIVAALLIAVVSWVTVAMTTSQTIMRTIQNVPINLEMQAAELEANNLSFIGAREFTANVEVNGARTVVGQLTGADFTLTVNVARFVEPGTYDLTIESVESHSGDFEIVRFDPPVLRNVRLDQIDSRVFFDIEPTITGLATPYGYMADTPRLSPSDIIRVTGPRTELERVDSVAVFAELSDELSRPYAREVPVTLLDIEGNVIDPEATNLTLDFPNLTLQIPVLRVRTMPLVVEFQNLPAGFPELALRQYMMKSDTTITIAGPISTMANYNHWRLGFINLRNLTAENNVFTWDIALPSDQFINIYNLQTVTVEFDSQHWASTTLNIPRDDMVLLNRPAGYEVTLQTASLSGVIFVGDPDEIAGLTVSDVVVEVNLNDRELTLGPQPFPVRISAPNKGMVWPVEENNNLVVYINVTAVD